ncbi:MAG: xylulose 5-phosphate 3-epimerase [Candidatus Binatia bacterium]
MNDDEAIVEPSRLAELTETWRATDPAFAGWAKGYGPIHHDDLVQWRIHGLIERLTAEGRSSDLVPPYTLLAAADRLAAAGIWLTVHQTYAARVHLDGRPLAGEDFKRDPQGHLGGALNIVPGYVGYLTANAMTGQTRSWVAGQGHTVGAIDSVNLLVGNVSAAHAARYDVSETGLTRFVCDFYSAALDDRGQQDSPVGSHVNAHTAGGISEGGYLGFTELQYVHMPLPGEQLVAFLSDGAFEEQRGSDWAPRWWRPTDCGLVAPIMIANGRRIDQRTTMAQSGGIDWFVHHLQLNGFAPIVFDGTDPAAFVWAILEMERCEEEAGRTWRRHPVPPYTIRLPYGVAVAPKGHGFYGEGTNPAHNLPLPGNPRLDAGARALFNEWAHRSWVPPADLSCVLGHFQGHGTSGRPRERDHALAVRDVHLTHDVEAPARPVPTDRRARGTWTHASPMRAVDDGFLALVEANPQLRPRVGNPDEMRSNRLTRTLAALQFRVTDPEPGMPESVDGAVITALNEEAIVAAALANKGGINLVATYEAFGAKMQGSVRQEVIFANHLREAGRPPGWLSVPLVLTSHTWENAKNEQSHQDPVMVEAMLGERAPGSRVLFPADYNTAAATIAGVYRTQGEIWTMVVPKEAHLPDLFSADDAHTLLDAGAIDLSFARHRAENAAIVLTAIGAYQLGEVLTASVRLAERDVPHRVIYMLEPGRFRAPRSADEATLAADSALVARLWPASAPARIFVVHTRPETMLGILGPLHSGPTTVGLGYTGAGGTLDVGGLLWINHCTWAHVLRATARVAALDEATMLTADERAALDGRCNPTGIVVRAPRT